MPSEHFLDDASLLRAFEARAIARPDWTHRAHVRVGACYALGLPLEDATDAMRRGIRALNAANGVEDTPTNGYHETVTVAWVRLLAHAVAVHRPADSVELLDRAPELLDRALLLRHYSRSRLDSPEARAAFALPDLSVLP